MPSAFIEGAKVIHDLFGPGIVVSSNDEVTGVDFCGLKHGMHEFLGKDEHPGVSVLTVALRAR